MIKIMNYFAERSASNAYEGALDLDTDKGKFRVCFKASNFCLHGGQFYNQNSCPINEADFKEMGFRISLNGSPIEVKVFEEIKEAWKEAVICD
jgi:hypothetical protein